MESLIGRNKDREITHQLSSWTKQTAPTWVQFPPDNLLQHGLSTSCSLLQSISPCCGLGSSRVCSVTIWSMAVHHGMQWDSLLYHVILQGQQQNHCSKTWSTFSPSLFTDRSVCRTFSQSCLSQLLQSTFNQLLKMLSQLCHQYVSLGSCTLLTKAAPTAANTLPCKSNTFIKTICPSFSLLS